MAGVGQDKAQGRSLRSQTIDDRTSSGLGKAAGVERPVNEAGSPCPLAEQESRFEVTNNKGTWRNPPAFVRVALVSGVFALLGVMAGMYVSLLLLSRVDHAVAALVGAFILAPFGAWLEACK